MQNTSIALHDLLTRDLSNLQFPSGNGGGIWLIDCSLSEEEMLNARTYLLDDENRESQQFTFAKHRNMFAATRAALRLLLSRCCGCRPTDIRLARSGHGKPHVVTPPDGRLPWFNVSHSGNYSAIVIDPGGPVGIDLEEIRPDVATEDIAERFFSPREHRWLLDQPFHRRAEQFFRLWVLKEAVVKADGRGLSMPFAETEIEFIEDKPRLYSRTWRLEELDFIDGYRSAVALSNVSHLVVNSI